MRCSATVRSTLTSSCELRELLREASHDAMILLTEATAVLKREQLAKCPVLVRFLHAHAMGAKMSAPVKPPLASAFEDWKSPAAWIKLLESSFSSASKVCQESQGMILPCLLLRWLVGTLCALGDTKNGRTAAREEEEEEEKQVSFLLTWKA